MKVPCSHMAHPFYRFYLMFVGQTVAHMSSRFGSLLEHVEMIKYVSVIKINVMVWMFIMFPRPGCSEVKS